MHRREFNRNLLTAGGAFVLSPSQSTIRPRVNGPRLNRHLAELAEFGKTAAGGTSRVAYSDADLQAREYTMKLMRAARLDVSIDAAGNIIGLWGMPIGEMFQLDELAAACATDGRYEFFLTSAPLNKRGGVASPPNALAIK